MYWPIDSSVSGPAPVTGRSGCGVVQLPSAEFDRYEWTFGVGEYFAIAGVPSAGTPFLGEVPICFGIDNPEKHYHVPLLCSPWSFSTYRGS